MHEYYFCFRCFVSFKLADPKRLYILSVGGNDLDRAGPPQTLIIGMRLYEFAKELLTMGVRRVVVCQVVRRQSWRHIKNEEGSA